MDLVLLHRQKNRLMRGVGDCNFEDFSTLGFQSQPKWTTAFSATWEKQNLLPTLAFGNYIDILNPDGPFEACDHTMLYRPSRLTYVAPYPYRLAIVHYRCYFRIGIEMVWRIYVSAMIDIIMCAMVQSNYGQWQQSQDFILRVMGGEISKFGAWVLLAEISLVMGILRYI